MTTSPTVGVVRSGWGPRVAPVEGASTFHRGVDIAAPTGREVVAPEAGTVTVAAYNSVRGYYLIVDHGRFRTLHQHLSKRLVKARARVGEGEPIGLVGSSGLSSGAHLHTEVHDGATPIDPAPWYRARGVTLGSRVEVAGVSITAPEEDFMAALTDEEQRRLLGNMDTTAVVVGQIRNAVVTLLGRSVDVDEAALAAALAPMLVPHVVAAVAGVAGLTEAQVEEAAERALRDVLGSLKGA